MLPRHQRETLAIVSFTLDGKKSTVPISAGRGLKLGTALPKSIHLLCSQRRQFSLAQSLY
jgi:hypothetical protein